MLIPTTTFGPITVAAIQPGGNSTVTVKLQQETRTTYPVGSRPQFALQEALTGATQPAVVTGVRRANQRFSLEEAANLHLGQELPGHIRRIQRATPKYPGQKPAYEGGFTSSEYLPEYAEDQDFR